MINPNLQKKIKLYVHVFQTFFPPLFSHRIVINKWILLLAVHSVYTLSKDFTLFVFVFYILHFLWFSLKLDQFVHQNISRILLNKKGKFRKRCLNLIQFLLLKLFRKIREYLRPSQLSYLCDVCEYFVLLRAVGEQQTIGCCVCQRSSLE